MTEPEALEALKRAAVEYADALDDYRADDWPDRCRLSAAQCQLDDACCAYARTVKP